MMLVLLYTVLCCTVLHKLARYFLLVCKHVRMLKSVPGPPKDNFLLGHINTFKGLAAKHKILEISNAFRGIGVFWFCHVPFVIVSEAHYAEVIFTAKGTRTKSAMYKLVYPWLGQGLVTSEGEKWQKHRKLITPAFHFSILNSFCEKFAKVSENLVDTLREQPEGKLIDVFEIMGLTTFDALCETAMGTKNNALKNSRLDYVHSMERSSSRIMKRVYKPWYWNDMTFFMMSFGRKLKQDLNFMFRHNDQMIEDRRNKKASQKEEIMKTTWNQSAGKKPQILLDVLLEAFESKSTPLTEKDVQDEVATFIFAGHETTTSGLSFVLYLLGLHHEVQTKCFEELDNIFQNSNRRPTPDDLHQMQYLEQVIKESLRLFPSVPLIGRETTQDVQFGKYTLPERVTLVMNVFLLHRDPKYFPDPEKFDPDRFSPENTANRHSFAYVPFAAGTRNCIGQKFAMMEMKVVTSYILRNFQLESAYGRDDLALNVGLTLHSEKSLDVKFKPRSIIQNIECKNEQTE